MKSGMSWPGMCLQALMLCAPRALWALVLMAVVATVGMGRAEAYPYYAQQAYENPREATGRIVCANCHLAAKPVQLELPHSVKPDTVFEAVVKVPYDLNTQQVLGDGSQGGLNVGAVLVLPEGFKIAPEDRIPEEMKEKVGDTYYQPYSDDKENIVLVGPVPGEEYQEIVFPVLSPDPSKDQNVKFLKYAVHVGGNRGRGQVYPTGAKSNNARYDAPASGQIAAITEVAPNDDEGFPGGYKVEIATDKGTTIEEVIPFGPQLLVKAGEAIAAGQPLTTDPNVGGFGQMDGEIVLQDPRRIQWLLAFFAAITVTQILFVLKKKQIEKVQAAEGI
ncbi:MAG: apocytochrome f [Oscillatoriales cyanobacterium SM2_2_1]|nr:apocytochrome f [Oscillatoriales cyanobacterium SM2_2_1]